MQRGRRDHFSPRGYLRGFIHPSRLAAAKPLWVFSVPDRRWKQRSAAAFGWKEGLYDYPLGSNPDGTAEEEFLRPETDFPVVREKIRSGGFATWVEHRDDIVRFAAMLSARSPRFLEQAAASIAHSLGDRTDSEQLAHNYALTVMRSEIRARFSRWRTFSWALRFTTNPDDPVVACDQSVGMDGYVPDVSLALSDDRTKIFFPISWDMCLFGSPGTLEPECAEFNSADLSRLRSFIFKQARRFLVSPVRLELSTLAA